MIYVVPLYFESNTTKKLSFPEKGKIIFQNLIDKKSLINNKIILKKENILHNQMSVLSLSVSNS